MRQVTEKKSAPENIITYSSGHLTAHYPVSGPELNIEMKVNDREMDAAVVQVSKPV